jgi:hypothetical protein
MLNLQHGEVVPDGDVSAEIARSGFSSDGDSRRFRVVSWHDDSNDVTVFVRWRILLLDRYPKRHLNGF